MTANLPSWDILTQFSDRDLKNADLNNCDREPIHIPSSIQPQGILFAVSGDDWSILQVSHNTGTVLGIETEELLNKPLEKILGDKQVKAIQDCLAGNFEQINPLPITIQRDNVDLFFDGVVHIVQQSAKIIVVELETKIATDQGDFFDFYRLVKAPVSRIQKANSFPELCDVIVQEVRRITGFDRVMVYRFAEDGSGEVIAEAITKDKDVDSFFGLHYPATDIPKQAKYLYALNFLRLIPDAGYQPIQIIPELNPLTKEPLDLSMSVLRSVSPIHAEYLANMGVKASMSVSIIKNKQLWGLIACHHNTPKRVPYNIRTICEFIGQIASFELAAKEESQDSNYKIKLQTIQQQLIANISQAEDLVAGLQTAAPQLIDLVGAQGVALVFDNQITLIGQTPGTEVIQEMLPWLESQLIEEVIENVQSKPIIRNVMQQKPKESKEKKQSEHEVPAEERKKTCQSCKSRYFILKK